MTLARNGVQQFRRALPVIRNTIPVNLFTGLLVIWTCEQLWEERLAE